jgi:hypothetical protein
MSSTGMNTRSLIRAARAAMAAHRVLATIVVGVGAVGLRAHRDDTVRVLLACRDGSTQNQSHRSTTYCQD